MQINIDVTTEKEDFDKSEVQITNEEDLINLATETHSCRAAMLYVISRQLGLSPEDLIPANKPLFMTGAAQAVIGLISRQSVEARINDKNFKIREFVGSIVKKDEGNQFEPYVKVDTKIGLKRVYDYLHNTVPGHIMGRLKIIAAQGGDVKEEAELLKAKIDEMVEILS